MRIRSVSYTHLIVIADDYILETAIQEGLAEKLDKDSLENIENINPLYQGQFYDPDDEYTVPYGAGIPLIVYDPEQVDIDIKGYKDLWDPSLEDSIAPVSYTHLDVYKRQRLSLVWC